MTTSSGESGFTPNGFSALVAPLSLLVSPPPLAQADRSEPPPVAATEARMARCRNSRREYWFGVLMDLPLLCADSGGSGGAPDTSGVPRFQDAVVVVAAGNVGRQVDGGHIASPGQPLDALADDQ